MQSLTWVLKFGYLSYGCLIHLYNIYVAMGFGTGLDITAYQRKSIMDSDIVQCIKHGYSSLFVVPVKVFMDAISDYNKNRIRVLCTQLT